VLFLASWVEAEEHVRPAALQARDLSLEAWEVVDLVDPLELRPERFDAVSLNL